MVIKVTGYQSKDGSLRANGRDITFPDGKTLFMGSSGTGAPKTAAILPRSRNTNHGADVAALALSRWRSRRGAVAVDGRDARRFVVSAA